MFDNLVILNVSGATSKGIVGVNIPKREKT